MTEDYKIKSLLGSGGFSNVFLAEHRGTGRRIAIKILNNAEGDARFAREAAVLQALECPYTVRLLEFGRSVSGPFMVFELVEGAQELDLFLEDITPLTQTGKVLGTPRYMPPEALRASETAAPKADVFAVGMIACHLLVGETANPTVGL